MYSIVAFSFFILHTAIANAKSSGFFPMSPRYVNEYSEPQNAVVHPFASSSRGAVLDIAVPDEQRLYGSGEPAPLERKSVVYGVQNLRRAFRAQKSKRRTETKDSAKESSISDSEASNLASVSSLQYRPLPPPVRRDADISPRCSYDADKWALHMESTLTYAVMFDRRTGESCRECLDRCSEKQSNMDSEKRELEKQEKEQKRKERKLQIINKEKLLISLSPPVTKSEAVLPAPDFEGITMDSETVGTLLETEETTPATTEGPCKETTMETDVSTEPSIVPTTTQSPSTKSIRRNPRKSRVKKIQNKENKSKNSELALQNEENKAAIYTHRSQRHRSRTVIRRKPVRMFKTNETLATTTEIIQELSSELARRKIQLYQQRKAVESKVKAPVVKRRRVRVEGQRLYGDVSGKGFDDPWSTKRTFEDEITVNEGEVIKSKVGKHRQKKQDDRKPTKKGLSLRKLRKSGQTTLVTNSPSLTLEGTTSTVGLSPEDLRAALSKEIRNFVSKELKHKFWRVHGTGLLKGKEEVDAPSGLEPMTKKSKTGKKRKETLTSSVCDDKEKVVMMLFANSTRKAYTAAVDIVKAQNQEDCLEFCERSLDCSSAVYSSHLCEMSATRARHTVSDIRPSAEDTYIEKACVESSVIRGRATHITGVPNHILAGFVEQVEDAYNIEDCITACYNALKQHGFHCMSAMWYPSDKEQNCLLNGESRRSHPALFISEDTGHQMIYFEHPDAALFRRMRDDVSKNPTKPRGWTRWSTCRKDKGERMRYSKCKTHIDVRKCPKEIEKCEVSNTTSSSQSSRSE